LDNFDPGGEVAVGGFGVEDFGGAEAGEFIDEGGGGGGDEGEGAGGEFDGGDVGGGIVATFGEEDGGGDAGGGFVEEGFVDEGAGREDAGDGAIDDALGLFGILDLITDGDAVALFDEAAEVVFCRVMGDARHGEAGGAFGEGETEGFGDGDGVVAEHFVEIAHAEEEDAVGVGGLEAGVLAHGGGGGGIARFFGGGRGWIRFGGLDFG